MDDGGRKGRMGKLKGRWRFLMLRERTRDERWETRDGSEQEGTRGIQEGEEGVRRVQEECGKQVMLFLSKGGTRALNRDMSVSYRWRWLHLICARFLYP
jgi:hypothetical protein